MTSEESSEHTQTDVQNAPSGSQHTPVMTTEAATQAGYTIYPPPISGEPFQRYKPIYSDGVTPPRANSPVTTTRLDFSTVDPRVIFAGVGGGTTGPHVVCCGQVPIYSTTVSIPLHTQGIQQNSSFTPLQPWQPPRPVSQFLTPADAQALLNSWGFGVIPDANSHWAPITAQQQSTAHTVGLLSVYPQVSQISAPQVSLPLQPPVYSASSSYPSFPTQQPWSYPQTQGQPWQNVQGQANLASQFMQAAPPDMKAHGPWDG
ncbi:uncharacterized protein [Rutidosis leptorrhynchoides]|uniref:uncharacterized protein n=1 Tax=Rutidosis leptorrhynchoides TaxID=125765 RepID=UPI003A99F434